MIDAQHRVTHWNRACSVLTGVPAAEMIGRSEQWRAFYDTARPIMADLVVDGVLESGIDLYYHGKFSRSLLIDDAYEAEDFFPAFGEGGRWLFFTAAALRNAEGEVIGAIETLQDITERRRAEAALREKEAYHIFADKQDTPEGGSFLRLNFYDQKGDLLEFRMISENEGTFVYPAGAFRYSLQLVQGGASRILFRRIEIVPEQNWTEWHPRIAEKFRNGVNRTCRWQD